MPESTHAIDYAAYSGSGCGFIREVRQKLAKHWSLAG
jgi:hypothetical protein